MPGVSTSDASIHITNLFGLVGFVILWFSLVGCTRILASALRNAPLIGWAIGPFGLSTLFLHEPSAGFVLLNALLPAFTSGGILYLGLFTSLPSPLILPHNPISVISTLLLGIIISSLGDWINALRDLRYPLWGEARVLRNIQYLRTSWASIHFTPFGRSYLREHFGSNPTELLQAL